MYEYKNRWSYKYNTYNNYYRQVSGNDKKIPDLIRRDFFNKVLVRNYIWINVLI